MKLGVLTEIGFQFRSVQSVSRVRLFATPWIPARQASLSITNSRSSLRLTSIESVMPSSHLILCRPLLLLPPVPPSIRVFSKWNSMFNVVANLSTFSKAGLKTVSVVFYNMTQRVPKQDYICHGRKYSIFIEYFIVIYSLVYGPKILQGDSQIHIMFPGARFFIWSADLVDRCVKIKCSQMTL